MHNKLELTAIKTIGVSTRGLLRPLFLATAILGIFYITVFDGISAFSFDRIKAIDTKLKQETRGLEKSLAITNSGVWFRDVFDSSVYIISAKSFDREHSSLFNVRFFEFDESRGLKRSIISPNAVISKDFWNLNNCIIATSDGTETMEKILTLPTKLSFSNINKMVKNPNGISFWNIRKYINMLKKVGLSEIKHKSNFLSRISSILQMFSFVMLVTIFCINYNSRNTRMYAIKVAILLSLAFPIYFFNNVLIAVGESGNFPLAFSIFATPIFMLGIEIFFVERR
jgi:lipopolysaccharide export LptBFGC system permease protein LptF